MSNSVGIRTFQPLIETWLEGWRSLDLSRVSALCDFDADFCFQPMETEHPLKSLEALEQYAEEAKGARQILEFACTNMAYDTCGDMLWAWAVCYYKALYRGATEPVAAPVRTTFVARRRGEGWKLVCVHHSTQQREGREATGTPREQGSAGDSNAKTFAKQLAETFTQGWIDLDLDVVGSVWDQEHSQLVYMPFEGPQGLRTWRAMQQYAERLRENVLKSGIRYRWPELTPDDISAGVSGDALWAHCQRDFFVYHPDDPQTKLGGHPYRETWLAHRKGGEWKAFHYHESVLGATPLVGPFVADWWPD